MNERRSEDFNHFTIGDDDPLLIKRVLIHFELVNSGDIRLLQAVCKRQGIVLIEEVDQSTLLLLEATLLLAVGLYDADAVLLDEHGELHVRRTDRHLQLRDGKGAEDVLDVGGELGAGDHLLMQVEGQTDDRAQSRDQVHLGLKLERLLLRLFATVLSALTNLGVEAGQMCARLSLGESLGLRDNLNEGLLCENVFDFLGITCIRELHRHIMYADGRQSFPFLDLLHCYSIFQII